MSEMIVADGVTYVRVFPLYAGEYDPPPCPPAPPQCRVVRAPITSRASASERILEALEGHPRTFTELARYTRGSSHRIRLLLTPLIDEGRVICDELPSRQGTRGRPQYQYRLSAKAGL